MTENKEQIKKTETPKLPDKEPLKSEYSTFQDKNKGKQK